MRLMDYSCNDFNCLYIEGGSNLSRGFRSYIGDDRDVCKFHFSTSFNYYLVEQLSAIKFIYWSWNYQF